MALSRLLQDELARLNWVDVTSTNLERVAYIDGPGRLWVRFHREPGSRARYSVYVYHYVPRAEYDAMMSAGSKGSYFAKHVRNVYAVDPVF